MPIFFTRARHDDLPDAVLPLGAVGSAPGWEPYGEPGTDPDALRAALALEAAAAAAEPAAPAAAQKPKPAPSGADPKEQ